MTATNEAIIILSANAKDLDKVLGKSKEKIRGLGAVARKMRDDVSGLLGHFKHMALFGGLAIAGVAAKQVFDFQKELIRLRVNSRLGTVEMAKFEKKIFEVAKARGVDPDELLGAAAKYQEKTGDLKTFVDAMDQLAMVSAGTFTKLEDVSLATANLSRLMGITKPEEIAAAFDIMQAQASAGAIELKDTASLMSELIPLFRTFGKSAGVSGLADLGAMLQMGEKGFGTAEETATGMTSAMVAITKNATKLRQAGIKVFEKGPLGKKIMRPLKDIIFDIGNSKLFKNPEKFQKVMGRQEAAQFIRVLNDPNLGGGRAAFEKLADTATTAGRVAEGYGIVSESAAGKMARAQARWKEVMNETMAKHIDTFARGLEAVAKAIDWIASNPKTAIALAILSKYGPTLLGMFGGEGMGGVLMGGGGGHRGHGRGGGGKAAANAGGLGAMAGLLPMVALASTTLPSDMGSGSGPARLAAKRAAAFGNLPAALAAAGQARDFVGVRQLAGEQAFGEGLEGLGARRRQLMLEMAALGGDPNSAAGRGLVEKRAALEHFGGMRGFAADQAAGFGKFDPNLQQVTVTVDLSPAAKEALQVEQDIRRRAR